MKEPAVARAATGRQAFGVMFNQANAVLRRRNQAKGALNVNMVCVEGPVVGNGSMCGTCEEGKTGKKGGGRWCRR